MTNTVFIVVVEPCLKNSGLTTLTVSPIMCNMATCSQSFALSLSLSFTTQKIENNGQIQNIPYFTDWKSGIMKVKS